MKHNKIELGKTPPNTTPEIGQIYLRTCKDENRLYILSHVCGVYALVNLRSGKVWTSANDIEGAVRTTEGTIIPYYGTITITSSESSYND